MITRYMMLDATQTITEASVPPSTAREPAAPGEERQPDC